MDIASLGIRVESNGVVKATGDLKGFQGEAVKSEAVANRLAASIKRAATSFAAGAAAAFSIRAIVSTLSDFEQSMSAVEAVMRPTAVELDAVRAKVKELGATTEFAASQVADGFKFMGLAGWDAAQSIEAMPAVLNLATAASMDLARAADISSNIMSAFGIQASEAAIVADTLAVANANANTSVEQLGDGMKYAGPVAQAFGISVGDTAAAIGTLSDAGIQGSMAGTGLRRVMSSLANATPAATRTLAAMGLTLKELNPTTNDLVDIVDKLAEAGLSAEAAFKIFGDRGAPAILALIENNSKLRELTGLLGDAKGAASDMANVMRNNLWGDIKNVQSAMESIIIALGESGFTGALRTLLQVSTEVLRGIAENMDAILRAATGLAVYMGGAWAVQFGLAAAATTALSVSLRALRLAIAGTGIGALAIILGDVAMKLWDAATATDDLADSIEGVTAPARSFFTFMKNGADAIGATFDALTTGIAAGFMGMFATVYTNYANFVNLIRGGLRAIGASDLLGLSGPEDDMPVDWATKTYLDLAKKSKESANLAAEKWAVAFGKQIDMDTGTFPTMDEMKRIFGIGDAADPGKPPPAPPAPPDKAAEKMRKAYDELTRGAHQFIASQQLEQQVLGMTAEAAARLRFEQQLLNQAANDNIKLGPAQRAELIGLAAEMAAVEERTRQLTEWYNIGKSAFGSFMSDFKRDLMSGTSLWESFGNAAGKALDSIADRALSMAANGIFDMIFGAVMGGIGGNFMGGTFGAPALQLGFQKGIPGYADGTMNHPGGLAWVGERGPELLNLPRGAQVIPHGLSMAMAANSNGGGDIYITNQINVPAGTNPETAPAIAREVTKELRRQLPDAIERHNRNPLRRAG